MQQKQLLLLTGVILLIVGALVFRTRSRVAILTQVPPTEIVTSAPSLEPIIIDSKRSPAPQMISQTQIKEWVKNDITERQLDMKSVALPKEGADSLLNVELKLKLGCMPGDADAIAMDLKAANGKVLLGTLEGMSAGTKSFSWEVPKDFLTGGVAKKQFKIAATTKPIQLGFYLCTAKGGDKTCQNKKVRDINEIFTEHLTNKPKAGEEERVIFYQYFLVDDRGLTTFQGYPKGEQQFDELKKYAGVRKFQGEKVNEGIDKAKAALTTLVSLPVVFNKDSLTIELPKYDVAACAKIQKEN